MPPPWLIAQPSLRSEAYSEHRATHMCAQYFAQKQAIEQPHWQKAG
jgi:hypothetical protein